MQLLSMLAKGDSPKQASQSLNAVKVNTVPVVNSSLEYVPYVVPGLFIPIFHDGFTQNYNLKGIITMINRYNCWLNVYSLLTLYPSK